ncbi:YutD family protein [Paenibacillus sp. MMO-177]|uniref:YutD family protein n=1 Tax=Paenibacillus sp. MMO-177 TaxID=3081289 RepID=UPI003018029A
MIQIGGKIYELIHENRNGWNADAFKDRYSEVLERYDFIIGDWGYNQLRLKGFFRDNHMKATKDSAYSGMSDYINEYCNFGCAYFVLEKTGTAAKSPDEEAGDEQEASSKQDTYGQDKIDAEEEQEVGASSLADAVLAGAAAAARESAAAGRGGGRHAEDSQQQQQQSSRQHGQSHHQQRSGKDQQHRRGYRPNGRKPIRPAANKDVAAASEQATVHSPSGQKRGERGERDRNKDSNKENNKEQGSRQ